MGLSSTVSVTISEDLSKKLGALELDDLGLQGYVQSRLLEALSEDLGVEIRDSDVEVQPVREGNAFLYEGKLQVSSLPGMTTTGSQFGAIQSPFSMKFDPETQNMSIAVDGGQRMDVHLIDDKSFVIDFSDNTRELMLRVLQSQNSLVIDSGPEGRMEALPESSAVVVYSGSLDEESRQALSGDVFDYDTVPPLMDVAYDDPEIEEIELSGIAQQSESNSFGR